MNINDAMIEVYKKQLAKYKAEHYIYKQRLARYEDLPPTQDELNEAMMQRTFKEAYEQEQQNINSDADKVNILIKRLNKPILNPYLDNIIKFLEDTIDKLEQQIEEQEQ
jgi:hypothetical protein